jgi:citronellol/citronellal dehydrogenase
MDPKWFRHHLGYTIAKYGMSMCVLGMAEEFRDDGIAVNALWPRTMIATAAVQNLLGGEEAMKRSRRPEIVADAVHAILVRASREATGNFYIDDEVLREEGVEDLSRYGYAEAEGQLALDLFLE